MIAHFQFCAKCEKGWGIAICYFHILFRVWSENGRIVVCDFKVVGWTLGANLDPGIVVGIEP